MDEIIFEIREAEEGGYTARAISESIFTDAETMSDLKLMIRDAVKCQFDEGKEPKRILLRTIRDEELEIDERFAGQLFKYRNFLYTKDEKTGEMVQYGLRLLTHNEIYFSAPSEFNDPFDCNTPIDVTKEAKHKKNELLMYMYQRQVNCSYADAKKAICYSYRDDLDKIDQEILQRAIETRSNYGIYSMTTEHDNILMWSHYSDRHHGFCIGLKPKELRDWRVANKLGFRITLSGVT